MASMKDGRSREPVRNGHELSYDQPAPSRNKPLIYAPSFGRPVTSFSSTVRMGNSQASVSMDTLLLRADVCTRQPEDLRRADLAPAHELLPPQQQVARPRCERLEGRVGEHPCGGHHADEHLLEDGVELGRHDDEALDAQPHVSQPLAHRLEQRVVAIQLLRQHDEERGAVALARLRADVDRLGQEGQQVVGERIDLVLGRDAGCVGRARLQRDDRLQHRVAARDLRRHIGVRMLAVALRPVDHRKAGAHLTVERERPVLRHHVLRQR
eukprot:7385545-Prymnesium_polylepis.1